MQPMFLHWYTVRRVPFLVGRLMVPILRWHSPHTASPLSRWTRARFSEELPADWTPDDPPPNTLPDDPPF